MRIVLALLMCWGVAFGQDTTKYFKSVDYGWNWQRGKFRGGLILPTDTTNNKLGIAQIDANCYAWSGTKWSKINSSDTTFLVRYYRKNQVDSAILANTPAEFDTTSLSNRIDTKLNITDTTNKWVANVTSLNDSTIRVIKGTTTTDITIKSSATVTNATRLVTTVYNNSGSTITKGSVVYINGAHSSNLPSIALARANLESTSAYTYGLVENDITNNNSGTVIQNGFITNLNLPTSTYTAGQTLYLSPTVAGGYTLTKPLAPNHYVAIGTITRAHPTFGTIQIAIRNGFQLDEMSDVSIAVVPLDSTLLQFSRTDSLWHDVSVFNAIGNKYLKPTDTASLSTRINAKGSGTLTSLTLGRGITGSSPITSTGTIGIDTTQSYTWTGLNTFSGTSGIRIASTVSGNTGNFTISPNGSAIGTPADFTMSNVGRLTLSNFQTNLTATNGVVVSNNITYSSNSYLLSNSLANLAPTVICNSSNSNGSYGFGPNGTKVALFFNATGSWNRGDFAILSNNAATTTSSTYAADSKFRLYAATGNVTIGDNVADNATDKLQVSGNLNLVTAGNKLKIATGTNASVGTATLSSGTVTVSTTAVTANSIIMLTSQSCSNCGHVYISAKTAGTSFVITSTNVLDASVIGWQIIN